MDLFLLLRRWLGGHRHELHEKFCSQMTRINTVRIFKRVISSPKEEVAQKKVPTLPGLLLHFKFRLYFLFFAAFFLATFFFAFFLVAILLNLMFSINGLTLVKIIIILH